MERAIRYIIDLRQYRAFRKQYPDPGKFIYFAYATPAQYEEFFGEHGLLSGLERHTALDRWGAGPDASPPASRLRSTVRSQWGVADPDEDLPFALLFTATRAPVVFYLSGAYRARERDDGAALHRVERSIRSLAAERLRTNG